MCDAEVDGDGKAAETTVLISSKELNFSRPKLNFSKIKNKSPAYVYINVQVGYNTNRPLWWAWDNEKYWTKICTDW